MDVLTPLAARLEAPADAGPQPRADAVPLVVDLDGTLLHTDTLVESLFELARQQPLQLLRLPGWLAAGRAQLKRQVALRTAVDVSMLPLDEDVLAYLRAQRAQGRRLVLATAADDRIAQAVADALGLFDTVLASDGKVNLSGTAKRDRLVAAFGEKGFDYVGDSARDLPVWGAARRALLVRPSKSLAAEAARVAPIKRRFDAARSGWHDYIGAMRVHHWLKNVLLLVPLFGVHPLYEPSRLLAALAGMLCFSLVASGVYLLNDLFDLPADRRHPHKKARALASGRVPLLHALLMVPALWLSAALLALGLPLPFMGVLAGYAALMVAYSMRLKNYPVVDTLVLALGYTLRICAGALAVAVVVPAWLLACSMALFFGLALLKRYAELVTLGPRLGPGGRVRGYRVADTARIAGLGIAANGLAVVMLALYPWLAAASAPAARRTTVWVLGALLLLWTAHMWRMARRGRIHDDPVAFALRDPLSRAVGAATALLMLVPL